MSAENRKPGDLRQVALNILEHARTDPTYLNNLKNDPETTLSAEGLTSEERRQLIGEFNLDEVQGYLNGCQFTCDFSCDTITCQITSCANIPHTGGPMETRIA